MSWFWNRQPNAGTPGDSAGAGAYPPPGNNDPKVNHELILQCVVAWICCILQKQGKAQVPLPEGGKKWVEFDPTGLERAAKAVKELDSSGTHKFF